MQTYTHLSSPPGASAAVPVEIPAVILLAVGGATSHEECVRLIRRLGPALDELVVLRKPAGSFQVQWEDVPTLRIIAARQGLPVAVPGSPPPG